MSLCVGCNRDWWRAIHAYCGRHRGTLAGLRNDTIDGRTSMAIDPETVAAPGCYAVNVEAATALSQVVDRPIWGNPFWCGKCASRIRSSLIELEHQYAQLGLVLVPGGTGTDTGKVSGSREARSPSPIVDAQDDVYRLVLAWEDAYRELRGFTHRIGRGGHAATVAISVGWLNAHLDDLLLSELAVDFGHEILAANRRLGEMLRAGADQIRKRLPCPRCQLYSLVQEVGAEYVACRNPGCGRLMTDDEYEAYVEEQREVGT